MRNTEQLVFIALFILFFWTFATGNFIDGDALVMLPNDFEEFCHLVPQSGIRMKLKAVVEKQCCTLSLTKVREILITLLRAEQHINVSLIYLSFAVVLAIGNSVHSS